MKNCPACKASAKIYKGVSGIWAYCANIDCGMSGPTCATEAEAEKAWDDLPREVKTPEFHGEEYEIDGITYHVTFAYNGPMTLCGIVWIKDGRHYGVQGVSICNPKDAYDHAIGERYALRRACGVGSEWGYYQLRPIFDRWRKDRHEAQIEAMARNTPNFAQLPESA